MTVDPSATAASAPPRALAALVRELRRLAGDDPTAPERVIAALARRVVGARAPADGEGLALPPWAEPADAVIEDRLDATPAELWRAPGALGRAWQLLNDPARVRAFRAARDVRGGKIDGADVVAATRLYTEPYVVELLLQNALAPWAGPVAERWPLRVRAPGPPRAADALSRLARDDDAPGDSARAAYAPGDSAPRDSAPRADAPRDSARGADAPRVLDPACGAGGFLVAAFHKLWELRAAAEPGGDPRARATAVLERDLCGIDLDARAVAVCDLELRLAAAERCGAWVPATPRLVVARGPLGSLATATEAAAAGEPALAAALAERWDVVATNPPYLGRGHLGPAAKRALAERFPAARHDLLAAFLLRALELVRDGGRIAMVTRDAWTFLASHAATRARLLAEGTLELVCDLGSKAFGAESGLHDGVASIAFVLRVARPAPDHRFPALRVAAARGPAAKARRLAELARHARGAGAGILDAEPDLALVLQARAQARAGEPLAAWLPEGLEEMLATAPPLAERAAVHQGLSPGDTRRLVRHAVELPPEHLARAPRRWAPFPKGGGYRRWFGPNRFVLDWRGDGALVAALPGGRVQNVAHYFAADGWTYPTATGGSLCVRRMLPGSIPSDASSLVRPRAADERWIAAFLNSRALTAVLRARCPKPDFSESVVARAPVPAPPPAVRAALCRAVDDCVELARLEAASDPLEPHHDPALDPRRGRAASALRLAIESAMERAVRAAYGLDARPGAQPGAQLGQRLDAQVGAPAGELPLVAGLDALPPAPVPLAGELGDLGNRPRIALDAAELDALRARARATWERLAATSHSAARGVPGALLESATAPIPPDCRLEALARALGVHPVSALALLGAELAPSERARRARDRVAAAVVAALAASPTGALALEPDGAATVAAVRERLGLDWAEIERDLGRPLARWLASGFFTDHVARFRRRPIVWHLRAARGPADARDAASEAGGSGDTGASVGPGETGAARCGNGAAAGPRATWAVLLDGRRADAATLSALARGAPAPVAARLRHVAAEGFACAAARELAAREPLDRFAARDADAAPPASALEVLAAESAWTPEPGAGVRVNLAPLELAGLFAARVLGRAGAEHALADRARWRADERAWCRAGRLRRPAWWS